MLHVPLIFIIDPQAHGNRAMVATRSAEGSTAEQLMRLMQTNVDSALEARHAVAQGRLWGVFIHPLSLLDPGEFVSGIARMGNVALSYGQTNSGGASVFGGGDSSGLHQTLFDQLKRNGQQLCDVRRRCWVGGADRRNWLTGK